MLNAEVVLLGAMERWTESPVTPNALERTAAQTWPSGTRVKRFIPEALHGRIHRQHGDCYLSYDTEPWCLNSCHYTVMWHSCRRL